MSVRGSAWLLPLTLLVGCGGGDTEAAGGSGSGAPEEAGFEIQGEVLTPEQAEAQAEKAITQENADAELKKLEESIGG